MRWAVMWFLLSPHSSRQFPVAQDAAVLQNLADRKRRLRRSLGQGVPAEWPRWKLHLHSEEAKPDSSRRGEITRGNTHFLELRTPCSKSWLGPDQTKVAGL